MKTSLCLLTAMMLAGGAAAIVNPHNDEAHCDSCHLELPVRGSDGNFDYSFRGEDIDPTCMLCHADNCCDIGSKDHTHASGVDRWDRELYGAPSQLPLHDGYITCSTCHYYIKKVNPNPRDYKLVRMVRFRGDKVDWTDLCLDCHKDY